MKERYIFPAVLSYAPDGISVSFPDLPGCLTCGDTDEEAVCMAEEAAGLHIWSMERDGDEIPVPTSGNDIDLKPNERIFLVEVWMPKVREEVKPVYVRKTLTIPSYLNEAAKRANVNFSNVLTAALKNIVCPEAQTQKYSQD